MSREMPENMDAAGIKVQEAPIETPGAIWMVERYHSPLRATYEKIRKELSRDHRDIEFLQMAVFTINATVGLEGLCPRLLVFWRHLSDREKHSVSYSDGEGEEYWPGD